jgi:hypothetical protein
MAVVMEKFPPAESPTSTMYSPVVPGQCDHTTETHNFQKATHIISAENLHNTLMYKGELSCLVLSETGSPPMQHTHTHTHLGGGGSVESRHRPWCTPPLVGGRGPQERENSRWTRPESLAPETTSAGRTAQHNTTHTHMH